MATPNDLLGQWQSERAIDMGTVGAFNQPTGLPSEDAQLPSFALLDDEEFARTHKKTRPPAANATLGPTRLDMPLPSEDFLDAGLVSREQQLTASIRQSVKGDPNTEAHIQELSRRVGIAPDLVRRNPHDIENTLKAHALQVQLLSVENPVLQMYFRDPAFAALAHDDVPHLSLGERALQGLANIPGEAARGWKLGRLQAEEAFTGFDIQTRGTDETDALDHLFTRMREIRAQEQALTPTGGRGFVESASVFLGQMSSTVPDAIKTGTETGVAFGLAATQSPLPLHLKAPTAASATALGFIWGFRAKMSEQAFRQEAGDLMQHMSEQGIEPSITQFAGAATGVANAALEFYGMNVVLGPLQRKFQSIVAQEVAKTSLKRASTGTALKAFGQAYVAAWAAEVSTEFLQEVNAIVGEELGKQFSKQEFRSAFSTEEGQQEIAERLADVFDLTAKAMTLLAIPGAAVSFHTERSRARRAEKEVEFFKQLNQSSTDSELRKRAPSVYHKLIEDQASANGVPDVYVDAGKFAQAMQESGVTVADLEPLLPGITQQLKDVGLDGEILVPTASYATVIAPTDFGAKLLPHVRGDVNALSATDMIAVLQNTRALVEQEAAAVMAQQETNEAFVASAHDVETLMYNQLIQAGRSTPSAARLQAQLVRDFMVTTAAREGVLPSDIYARYPYKVEGQGEGTGRFLSQAATAGADPNNPTELTEAARLWREQGVESPYFKKFFGESKVVDATGAPLVVYRGLDKDYGPKMRVAKDGALGAGVYLTPDAAFASTYATEGQSGESAEAGNVVPLYAAIQNPLILRMDRAGKYRDPMEMALVQLGMTSEKAQAVVEKAYEEKGYIGKQVMTRARQQGYDGIMQYDGGELREVVAFSPTQIKSAIANTGAFDPNDPSILHQSAFPADLWAMPTATEQALPSGKTSIKYPEKKVGDVTIPTKIGKAYTAKGFKSGTINLDIGGGKYDQMTAFLRSLGVTNFVYDPFNRTTEHNANAVAKAAHGRADTVTISNVLNVVQEEAQQRRILMQAVEALKVGGEVRIGVYKSAKAGELAGRESYQHGASLKSYLPMVQEFFPNASIEDGIIVATKPQPSTAPVVAGQSPEIGTLHGLLPHLRVLANLQSPVREDGLITQATTNKNAQRQLAAVDEILARHPDATRSIDEWNAMVADALGGLDIPAPPYNFIQNLNGDGAVRLLRTLSPGQIADADHGMANAAAFRDDYINKRISIEDTGRLLLWSFLSRGVSPYVQESLFIDSFDGIAPWIQAAVDGTIESRLSEYRDWAATVAPAKTGRPGAAALHNLNAFGKTFLVKMSKPAGDGTTRSRLQVLHDLLSDPQSTGPMIRRRFMEMGEGVGIGNKVISFTLLVAGFKDVMVLDRVQIRELWNDGRFDGLNLYDGYKAVNKDGDNVTVTGSGLVSLTMGARGLLLYEAMERGLHQHIAQIYGELGRPDAGSLGRYHWETWVASSNQEASHATIDAIIKAARGVLQPLSGIEAKEGEYGAYAYGARYGISGLGVPYFLYPVPGAGTYRFTVAQFSDFLKAVKSAKYKVVPAGFLVSESGNIPWHQRPGVDTAKLDALAAQLGERYEADTISRTDERLGLDGPVTNRLATDPTLDGDAAQHPTGEAGPGTGLRTPQADRLHQAAVGSPFFQETGEGPRGSFDPARLLTILNEKTDASTFLHETAHFFLTAYSDMAQRPGAPEDVRADMKVLLDWFGVQDLATWNAMALDQQRKYHEQFAYNYEIYLFEGRAPSVALQVLFDRFSAWISRAYKSIRDGQGLREKLSGVYQREYGAELPILTGEVRQVMDRMLASREQIQQAEAVRKMGPLFQTQEEARMDDASWSAYQAFQRDATEAASASLTTASLRQMKWLANARGKVLKTMQKETAAIRKGVREAVEAEVVDLPIYRAMAWLKRGDYLNKQTGEEAHVDAGHKFSLDAVRAMYPTSDTGLAEVPDFMRLGTGRYGMLAKEGLHPDIVAGMFQFGSGDLLVRQLLDAKPLAEEIEARTDARMLDEYGDLNDPKKIEAAVERAVHNEARTRFVAVELRALAKATQPVRVMMAAAKQAARDLLARKTLDAIRPYLFARAETKAAKAADAALRAGNSQQAVEAKQSQLLNNQLATEAIAINTDIADTLEIVRRIFGKDEAIAKLRDLNYVGVARAILAMYGLGKADAPAASYLKQIQEYDPEFYTEIEPMVSAHLAEGKPFVKLTYAEYQDLRDQVVGLWHLARRTRQSEIDGQLKDRTEIEEALVDQINLIDTRVEGRAGNRRAVTDQEKRGMMLLGAKAALRRVESWVSAMDRGDPHGPFRTYLWTPISEAVTQYRLAKVKVLEQYLASVLSIEKGLVEGKISAPEIGYEFANKAELLHAILHTGNQSNLRKLLLGRKDAFGGPTWGAVHPSGSLDTSRWDAFLKRMYAEKVLTKVHYDFAQKVWDLTESMKPAAQKAHKDMYGFYFSEITAHPIQTPFGEYRGGYIPAITDPWIVTEAAMRNEQAEQAVDNSYMFPTTGRGFTKGRTEYNQPLLLDIGSLPSHLDKVLRFTFIEPRIKDVGRIVKNSRGFASALDRFDPTLRGDMLMPWLQRTAQQMIQTPMKGFAGKLAHKFFSELRTRTGLQMMVGNLVNALQQLTSVSISALRVAPRYLRNALWLYIRQPSVMAERVAALSPYMMTRMTSSQFEVTKQIEDLLLNPSQYERLRAFAAKHGYFAQQGMQNLVDVVVWTGAYNQAMETLPWDSASAQLDAVRQADSAVRETQGSFAPEDVSRLESGNAFVRAFTMFYSYFNMQANLLGTEYVNAMSAIGVKRGMGRLLFIYMMGFMIPAVLGELLIQAAGGFNDGDDDEYDQYDAMALFFGSQVRSGLALVPVLGPTVTAGFNVWNKKPYDDRISTSPAIAAVESTIRAPRSVYKAIADDASWKMAVRDTLTAIGMITRLPLGQLGKPLGYAADVAQGKAVPQGASDVARGLLAGKDVNRRRD